MGDASVEEIFHLITQFGYSNILKHLANLMNQSRYFKATDVARGGRQIRSKMVLWTHNNTDSLAAR